jgi:LuxR family maltose regulon positive regulatory protein
MTNNSKKIDLPVSLKIGNYMPRPRVDKILDHATRCMLVYVVAGAGYGKTQAVRQYIEQQPDAIVRWVQLTEGDNVGSRYWESLTHNISLDNLDLANHLREFGFPETPSRFKQFADILKTTEHRSIKTFFVFDDFHLIHTKEALVFAERCAHLKIPGACMIIISRKEPEINAVTLFAKGKASIITEDELRFTDDEVEDILKLRDIRVYKNDLPKLLDATKGWALAIDLLSLVLKRVPENLDFALGTMKQNIFKLMETEAWDGFSEEVQKTMVRLSLVSDLPLTPFHEFSGDTSFLQNTPQLAYFIWFDSLIGDYRIHPLYIEFLQSKQDVLSTDEKQDTYQQAAQWCSENNFYFDAMKYLKLSRQYERMVQTLFSYPFRLPYDTCNYFLNVLENLDPEDKDRSNQSVLLLKNFFIPLLLLWIGRYEEASVRSWSVIREWENKDSPFTMILLSAAYSNLAYIDMYTCLVTHIYDAPKYLRKSIEYRNLSSIPSTKITGAFSIADIRSFACLVGEGASLSEFDEFLKSARDTAKYIAETPHGMYHGYEDLAACEIAFYKNQLTIAKSYANQAMIKACEKGQHSIEAMAVFYLFRIALLESDYSLVQEILRQRQGKSGNPNFWNRQLLNDLGSGFFYALAGIPKKVPSWLNMDEKETAFDVSIPVRELICAARYYLVTRKYSRALALLCSSYPREPQERFLFGELTLSLLTAVARIKIGDTSGAVNDLEKAYSLSFDGLFEMPFIELGKDLHPLCVASGQQTDCNIPQQWLKTIDRKASAYAKKVAAVLYSFKKEKNIDDTPQLSEREREVLSDLYHGLNREEIAASRYLSINTVNKIIPSIFIKLNANNSADAMRIAIEKKLIE